MNRKLKIATALVAVLSVLVPAAYVWAYAKAATTSTYGVLMDERDRCIFAWASEALPSTVVCQDGAFLWRTDTDRLYIQSSGSWSTEVFTRTSLAEEALSEVPLPIADHRLSTFAGMGVSAADDGEFHFGLASNGVLLLSDTADNTTDTSTFRFMFTVPENYVAAGDVTLRFRTALIESGAAATDNGSSIDLSCYEQGGDGTVGSDIVATAAQTYAATDTWYNKDFSLTATDIVAGDLFSCLVTGAVIENNAGAETLVLKTAPVQLLLDIKG